MRLSFVILFLNLFLANHSSLAQEDAPLHAFIYGGKLVARDDVISKSTVALVDAWGKFFCSGVLIGNNLVLTAAHCADSDRPYIRFARDANNNLAPTRSVVRIKTHELYQKDNEDSLNDIALLEFKGELPMGYVPAELPESSSNIPVGSYLLAAGYGTDQARHSPAGSGFLRKTALKVLNIDLINKILQLDQSQKTGVCYGDSGGPLYLQKGDGTLIVLGIADTVATNSCRQYSVYALVSEYLDWIHRPL